MITFIFSIPEQDGQNLNSLLICFNNENEKHILRDHCFPSYANEPAVFWMDNCAHHMDKPSPCQPSAIIRLLNSDTQLNKILKDTLKSLSHNPRISLYKPVTDYRRNYLTGREFLYLLVVGVDSKLKGKGFGRKLIDAAIEKAENANLPLYVGAGSEDNFNMYARFGFKLHKKIALPHGNLHEWEMVRESTA